MSWESPFTSIHQPNSSLIFKQAFDSNPRHAVGPRPVVPEVHEVSWAEIALAPLVGPHVETFLLSQVVQCPSAMARWPGCSYCPQLGSLCAMGSADGMRQLWGEWSGYQPAPLPPIRHLYHSTSCQAQYLCERVFGSESVFGCGRKEINRLMTEWRDVKRCEEWHNWRKLQISVGWIALRSAKAGEFTKVKRWKKCCPKTVGRSVAEKFLEAKWGWKLHGDHGDQLRSEMYMYMLSLYWYLYILYYIMLYYMILYYLILYRIISYHIILYNIISYHII